MPIIYRITNIITNKSYIGQTTNTIKKRWKDHIVKSKKSQYHFSNAIRKYGTECWGFDTLEIVTDINLLNEREIFWINHYNTFNDEYNSDTGGKNGRIVSDQTKKKLSEQRKGIKLSNEHKQNLSIAHIGQVSWSLGKTATDEHKKHLSESHIGNKHSEETRKRMSESAKNRKNNKND